MKKILSIFVIICILLTGCSRNVVSTNIDNYISDCESVKNASLLMPDIADLGAYSELKYTYQTTCYSYLLGFYTDGIALFAKYDPEVYKEQKENAMRSYTFLEAPVMEDGSDHYELPLTEFVYNGYLMKVVPDEDYIDFSACKSFMMLGFNDEEGVIAYLYFYDFDIDCIAQNGDDLNARMIHLVDRAFTWVEF